MQRKEAPRGAGDRTQLTVYIPLEDREMAGSRRALEEIMAARAKAGIPPYD